MKITLELYGDKHIFESNSEDYSAEQLKEIFSRLMVQATFPPSVIEEEDGHYEFVDDSRNCGSV